MWRSSMLWCAVVCILAVCAVNPALAYEGDEGDPIPGTFGVGLGLPYGGVGGNFETGQQTRLSVGVGWLPDNIGWNVGIKHYFQPLVVGEGSFSISAYYGVNQIQERIYISPYSSSHEYDTDTGFSVGLGWTGDEIDLGILVPFNDVPAGYEEYGPPVKIYIGYRF